MSDKNNVSDILKTCEKTFTERSEIYGDAFENIGNMMMAVFPNGLILKTKEDFDRFYALTMTFNKLNRYASNIENGGHKDSAHDCIVYAAILESFTQEK